MGRQENKSVARDLLEICWFFPCRWIAVCGALHLKTIYSGVGSWHENVQDEISVISIV